MIPPFTQTSRADSTGGERFESPHIKLELSTIIVRDHGRPSSPGDVITDIGNVTFFMGWRVTPASCKNRQTAG